MLIQITDKSFRPISTVFHASLSIPLYSRAQVFYRKAIVKNFAKFTGKHLCLANFVLKKATAQVVSCEFFEIFQVSCSCRKPPGDCFCNLRECCEGCLGIAKLRGKRLNVVFLLVELS